MNQPISKVIVIEAAGLSPAFIGAYGNDWVASPNLDRMAAEGVVFDQHCADVPRRGPSGASSGILSNVYAWPGRHGVANTMPHQAVSVSDLNEFPSAVLQALESWFASDLPILWVNGPDLFPPWKISEELLIAYEEDEATPIHEIVPAPWSVDALVRMQNAFAGVVTFFDAQLGVILEPLFESGLIDHALVIVTSRCGMPLGEHGTAGDLAGLFNESVHLPLILRLPGRASSGLRVSALTQPADLAATLAESLEMPVTSLEGRSLWPILNGKVEQVRDAAFSAYDAVGVKSRLVRLPEWAVQYTYKPDALEPEARVFEKPADRHEVHDLASQSEAIIDTAHQKLQEFETRLGSG